MTSCNSKPNHIQLRMRMRMRMRRRTLPRISISLPTNRSISIYIPVWIGLLLVAGHIDAFHLPTAVIPYNANRLGASRSNTKWSVSSSSASSAPSSSSSSLKSVKKIRAAVYQCPAPPNDIEINILGILNQAADALRVASIHGVGIVLFPELFLTGGVRVTTSTS
eukprot:919473_1